MRYLLTPLLLCSVALAANDFTSDANCVALWSLESGSLTTDSIGGNTLGNSGYDANTVTYKEGSASGYKDALADIMWRSDGNLDAGFPLKNGDTNKKISICCWFYVSAFPASDARWLVGKYGESADNQRSFLLYTYNDGAGSHSLRMGIGHTGGTTAEVKDHGGALSAGRWYHVGATFQDSDKAWKIRIWDDTAGAYVAGTESGTATNNINVEDAEWHLGSPVGGSTTLGGYIDEVVVFNDVLSTDEIDQVRAGTYGNPCSGNNDFTGDANAVSLYRHEPGALGTDTIGSDPLTVQGSPTADSNDYKEGCGGVEHEGLTDYFSMLDSDLAADFPGKNGETNKKMSFCFWVKFSGFPSSGSGDIIFAKGTTGKASYLIRAFNTGGNTAIGFGIGYSGGGSWESDDHATAISTGIWYHVGITYQDSDKSYRIRIWDDNAQAILGSDKTGTKTNNINIEDGPIYYGRYVSSQNIEAKTDEFVVFNDVLTADEIDQIRGGTFGATAAGAQIMSVTFN